MQALPLDIPFANTLEWLVQRRVVLAAWQKAARAVCCSESPHTTYSYRCGEPTCSAKSSPTPTPAVAVSSLAGISRISTRSPRASFPRMSRAPSA